MKPYFLVKYSVLDGFEIPISGGRVDESNYLSVIVGKNGSGKSRVLYNIAMSIAINSSLKWYGDEASGDYQFYDLRSFFWEKNYLPKLIGVSYESNGEKSLFWPCGESKQDYSYRYINKTPPANIICVSSSFFHKFPSTNEWPLSERPLRKNDEDIYINLCMTEINKKNGYHGGRGSNVFGKGLMKSLLMNKDSLSNTLKMLRNYGGYDGVDVSFCFNDQLHLFKLNEYNYSVEDFRDSLNSMDFRDLNISDEESCEIMNKIIIFMELVNYKELLKDERFHQEAEEIDYIFTFQHQFKRKPHGVNMSFFVDEKGENSSLSDELRELVYYFNGYGLLTVKDVSFFKSSMSIPLYSLSSGELNVLTTLTLINSEIKDSSLILIDEPEINLHPKWQEEIIPTLLNSFSHISGCHFIIATHSPLIAASIKENNSSVVIIGDNGNDTIILPGSKIKGQSSDFQLFYTLKHPGPHNEYLIRKLLTIIAKRKNGMDISHEDVLFINDVSDLLIDADEGDKVKYLLAQALALI